VKIACFNFIIVLSAVLLTSCNGTEKEPVQLERSVTSTEVQKSRDIMESTPIYFIATGDNPNWKLELSALAIRFTCDMAGFAPFLSAHVEPSVRADANVKRYVVATESGEMLIEIMEGSCPNSEYTVHVDFKDGKDAEGRHFDGCGDYKLDKSISGKWMLESWNGKTVNMTDFPDELPFIELDMDGKTFTAMTGCNSMNGKLIGERWNMRFTDIASTKMMCPNQALELEILANLKKSTSYAVTANNLKLRNADGILLTFAHPRE